MVGSTILQRGLSAHRAKLIHSSLSEQSNGNGNSSGLKMNLNSPLRDFECSAKMCDSVAHGVDTEGEPADVGRLLLLKLFTLCLRPAQQKNGGCASFVIMTQVRHVRATRVQTDRCREGKAETTVGMNRLIQTCKYCFKGLS